MPTKFYPDFIVLTFSLLSYILFGFEITLFLLISSGLSIFLLVNGPEWSFLLPVRVARLNSAFDKDSNASFDIRSTRRKRKSTMFGNWNPLQWMWKGKTPQKTGSTTGTRSKFIKQKRQKSHVSSPPKKTNDNPLNITTPIFKSTPLSPRKEYSRVNSPEDYNASISVLNASGPLLSTPMMPMIKRAMANRSGLDDTFSPDLSSPEPTRRPVRRANTFHFTPTHPVDSSTGVLPWVRFGRRDRHSLYRANINSFKPQNTVRVAPPDPHRQYSASLTPLKERSDNVPKSVDTQAVVNALRECRKRSFAVAGQEESSTEEVGQHAKRRRQESSQSTASSASLPPLPDHLPDLSDKNVLMQLDTASLKRPSAPSREAFDDSELDTSMAKRQKNNRNNPISSSLSSSRKMIIKERIEAKINASPRDVDMSQNKRATPDWTAFHNGDFGLDVESPLTSQSEHFQSIDSSADNTPDVDKMSTSSAKNQSAPSSTRPSTPNRRVLREGLSRPTRRRNMSLYPGLNTSFAGVPMARVSATAEDYERDREAEQQRVKDLLEDVETNIKQGSKLGGLSTSTKTLNSQSSTFTSIISTTSTVNSSAPSLLSTSSSSKPSLVSTQILGLTTSITSPLTSSVPSPTSTPAFTLSTSTPHLTTTGNSSKSVSTSSVTASSGPPPYTFKPILSTSGVGQSTNTTPSVSASVSSTSPTSFDPIFPPVSSTSATLGAATLGAATGLAGLSAPTTKSETQITSLGLGINQTTATASSAGQFVAGNSSKSVSTSSVTESSGPPLYTFKPMFSTSGVGQSTNTTPSVSTPVSSTSPTSFNPIFPSVSSTAATGLAGLSAPTKSETQITSLGLGINQTTATASSAGQFVALHPAGSMSVSTSSTAPATTKSQGLGVNPLSTSTPKPAAGFSSGATGFSLGQAQSMVQTTSAGLTTATGLMSAGNFSMNQQPTTLATNPASSQPLNLATGFPAGSNIQTTGPSGGNTPAKNLFGATTQASSTGSSFQFGQCSNTNNAPSGFTFGQGSVTTAPSSVVLGQTGMATAAAGNFQFGQSNAASPAMTSDMFGQATSSGVTQSHGLNFGSSQTQTTTAASMFGVGTVGTASGKPAQTFGTGTGTASPFGMSTGTPPTFGLSTGTMPTFGASTGSAQTFGTSKGTAPTFGSTAGPPSFGTSTGTTSGFGTASANAFVSGTDTAPTAFGTGTGSVPGFGSSTGTAAPVFGAKPTTTTAASSFSFGNTGGLPQPNFGASSTKTGVATPTFGTPTASGKDQKQTSVFGTPTSQTGFNFGASANSFSAGSQQNSTAGTFQFGQSSQQVAGENKGFNFNASFSGTPQMNFGTPGMSAGPSAAPAFGTPNMFTAGGQGVPPKSRVTAPRARRRAVRR